jgi:hypothetical protein
MAMSSLEFPLFFGCALLYGMAIGGNGPPASALI